MKAVQRRQWKVWGLFRPPIRRTKSKSWACAAAMIISPHGNSLSLLLERLFLTIVTRQPRTRHESAASNPCAWTISDLGWGRGKKISEATKKEFCQRPPLPSDPGPVAAAGQLLILRQSLISDIMATTSFVFLGRRRQRRPLKAMLEWWQRWLLLLLLHGQYDSQCVCQ